MEMKPRKWKPIQSLPLDWNKLQDAGIAALVGVWNEQVQALQDKDIYKTFLAKLRREWAIETGVIERLYELKDSATKTLIEHGLDSSLLSSSDVTGRPLEQVLALIRDQESAINSMYMFVAEGRNLTMGYVKELHFVLTANQSECESVDSEGRSIMTPLIRGEWRKTEAQVTDSEGTTWLYCEPALIESQMLNLLDEFQAQSDLNVPPEIRSAWLHHRFTLIHPFQDGNGRVARCLATLVMLKARWFPLVVTNADKTKYIAALRAADALDLTPLVQHFNELQKRTIRRALSLSASVISETETVKSAMSIARQRLGERNKKLAARLRNVLVVAEALRIQTIEHLRVVAIDTDKMLKEYDSRFRCATDDSPHGDTNDHYYRAQIVQCANMHDYYANLAEYRSWAAMKIDADDRVEVIFSFHGLGRDARGVLCCSAIFCQKNEAGLISGVEPLEDLFEFTYKEKDLDVASRFSHWLDKAISEGVKRWSNTL
jgi:Fic family protein